MSPLRSVAMVTILLLTSACAAKLQVAEITNNRAAGPIAGIPFRVPQRYDVTVYEKTAEGYKQVHKQKTTLADPHRLFVLGFESQVLSNTTADFQMNADNTLSQVGLKAESQGQEFLTEAGTQISAFATARESARTAKQARETAAEAEIAATAADVTKASGLNIAADKAWQAALLADLQAENLRVDPAATREAQLVADNKARSAKLDANEAARLAGKSPYFPEVVP